MKEDAKKIVKFFHYAEGLKKELRNLWLSNGRQEDSAEHSWRMALMVMLIAPKLSLKVNSERAMKIALIHDIVEIEAKDTPLYQHFNNKEAKKDKKKREEKAISNIYKALGGVMGDEIRDLWHEYEDQITNEAKVVKAVDKLESRLQFIEDGVKAYKQSETAMFPEVKEYFTKLFSIDPFLKELGEIAELERDEKLKAMKAEGRFDE